MEAMPKNRYENEKTKLPSLIESLRMVAEAFGASPKKTTKLDKQLEDLKKQTNTDLELALFSDKSDNTNKAGKAGKTGKGSNSLSDRLKVVKEPKGSDTKQTQVISEQEMGKDERI